MISVSSTRPACRKDTANNCILKINLYHRYSRKLLQAVARYKLAGCKIVPTSFKLPVGLITSVSTRVGYSKIGRYTGIKKRPVNGRLLTITNNLITISLRLPGILQDRYQSKDVLIIQGLILTDKYKRAHLIQQLSRCVKRYG